MTLQPLLAAPFVIQIHALAAITAFAVGLVQLTAPKGTPGPALKVLHDSAKAAMEEPSFVALMKSRGVDVDYKSGDKLRQELAREHKEWNEVLKRLGMIKK